MRSWYPIPPEALDRKRLLGEHNELLIIGKAVTGQTQGWKNPKAWTNHPEVKRWREHTLALKNRHDEIAREMIMRGYKHNSPWPKRLVTDNNPVYPDTWEPEEVMLNKLHQKTKGDNMKKLNCPKIKIYETCLPRNWCASGSNKYWEKNHNENLNMFRWRIMNELGGCVFIFE